MENYDILRSLGAGGGGSVYLAYHKRLQKNVVLKKISKNPAFYFEARREVDILKELNHPCLPHVYDFLLKDGDVYTVMDYIPGESFAQKLKTSKRFSQEAVIGWAKQLCDVLSCLHGQSPPIIHGDIKPANIMLKPDNKSICLIDFNVSISMDGKMIMTGCTPGYAAPEQVAAVTLHQGMVDERADIYSLGACLYEFLTGEKPKPDDNGKIEDPRKKVSSLNKNLCKIVLKCLKQNPDERYASARDLRLALDDLDKEKYRWIGLGVFVLAVALAGGGFYWYKQSQTKKVEQYVNLVEAEWNHLSSGDYQQAEEYYEEARALFPERPESYSQMGYGLFIEGRYSQAVSYIEEVVSDASIAFDRDQLGELYYIQGNAFERIGNHAKAISSYEEAINNSPSQSSYYRDYAVSLAQENRLEEAVDAMESAQTLGADEETIHFVEAQILYKQEKYEEASQTLDKCLEDAQKNQYIFSKATILKSECEAALVDGQKKALKKKASVLKTGLESISSDFDSQVRERLADTYIRLENLYGDGKNAKKAVSVLEVLYKRGNWQYDDMQNLARLYTNLARYEDAKTLLEKLNDTFGESYVTYRELAFNEGLYQDSQEVSSRDYGEFKSYYESAKRLKESQGMGAEQDAYMDLLEEKYTLVNGTEE